MSTITSGFVILTVMIFQFDSSQAMIINENNISSGAIVKCHNLPIRKQTDNKTREIAIKMDNSYGSNNTNW